MRHGDVKQVLRDPGDLSGVDPFNPMGTKPLPLHVQRMAVETQQVVTNLGKLSEFIHEGKVFQSLPVLEQQLMAHQKDQMTTYAKTLCLRYCMALLAYG